MRLDLALVAQGLVRSRTRAQKLIKAGEVSVDGTVVRRPAEIVDHHSRLELLVEGPEYVSRAALKLIGALTDCQSLGLDVADRFCLDAGAAAGGFTQVLLGAGVRHVVAVDVGHGQFDEELATDPRVTSFEGVHLKDLSSEIPCFPVDLVVADVSFISLTAVLPAIRAYVAPECDFLLLIKPQFELTRAALNKHGVVHSAELRKAALERVTRFFIAENFALHYLAASRLPGPSGNIEYFAWVSIGADGGKPKLALSNDLLLQLSEAIGVGGEKL